MKKRSSIVTEDVSIEKILLLHAKLIARSVDDQVSWSRDVQQLSRLARRTTFTWAAPGGVVKVERIADHTLRTMIFDPDGVLLRCAEYQPTRALYMAAAERYDRQTSLLIDRILAELEERHG